MANIVEKQHTEEKHIDDDRVLFDEVDASLERRIRIKCDLNLLPVLFILLLLAFLDRVNIGNARIQGLEADLGMKGQDYNIALSVFFITYILCEIPSNVVLKNVRPSVWLSGLMFGWGVITTLQGVTQSFAGLVVCRILLGVFEAGFFPGAVYLISMYYKRYDVQIRISLFFCGSILAGAISGLLAYAIAGMQGLRGYSVWRWIFIIEGCATCAIAAGAYFIIPDWPETARFLKPEERLVLLNRLAAEAGEGTMTKASKKAAKLVLTDVKIYLGILMFIGVAATSYAASFFIPTILAELGWTAVRAQVMTIPIYAFAAVSNLVIAFVSDHIKHRYSFIMVGCIVSVIGYAILLETAKVSISTRYMALFFVVTGVSVALPVSVTWLNNNMGGHYKRGVAAAAQIGFGNTAGLIASNIFITTQAPYYRIGYSVSLSLILLTAVSATMMAVYMKLENKKRDEGKRDYMLSLPADELYNLGDAHPTFRFVF